MTQFFLVKMQMGVWTEDDDRGRGAAAGGGVGSTTSATLARTGRRRESMPGEFFTVIF